MAAKNKAKNTVKSKDKKTKSVAKPSKPKAAKPVKALSARSNHMAKTKAKPVVLSSKASKSKEKPSSKVAAKASAPSKSDLKAKKGAEKEDRKRKAMEALEAAMKESAPEEEEEEFDPAAFYAASAAAGADVSQLRPHMMRKERVDLNILVRYRYPKNSLVHNGELINLSKGGLCLKCKEKMEEKTQLRIEIPLPHTSELFAVQAEVIWSENLNSADSDSNYPFNAGLTFLPMSLAKQSVINSFIQQRRDEIIMAKIGLDRFGDSAPVAGLD